MSILGAGPSGPVRIDVDRLIETRAVVMANSGGGKSWALRRLLEQTHGAVQQIVIDVEDEFATLREKHDHVLAGRLRSLGLIEYPQPGMAKAKSLLFLEVK